MCWCRPEVRTPNCGRVECRPPDVERKLLPRLEQWSVENNCLVGNVYHDDRFAPGFLVRTSEIIDFDMVHATAKTRNTLYKLGQKLSSEQAVEPIAESMKAMAKDVHNVFKAGQKNHAEILERLSKLEAQVFGAIQ